MLTTSFDPNCKLYRLLSDADSKRVLQLRAAMDEPSVRSGEFRASNGESSQYKPSVLVSMPSAGMEDGKLQTTQQMPITGESAAPDLGSTSHPFLSSDQDAASSSQPRPSRNSLDEYWSTQTQASNVPTNTRSAEL